MASRYEVEVIITSAKDLKNVNWRHGKLKPYAVVWVDSNRKCTTHADETGDTTPFWDAKLTIPFDSPVDDSTLHVDIVHDDAAKPLIGSAKLRLRDVVDEFGLGSLADRNLQMKRPSGRPQGKVAVKVTVHEPRYYAPDPYLAPAYGVPAPYAAYAAPPAGYPVSYGAPAPTYPAYGQGGYVEEKKKSSFGGLGTGLAVGAVAGGLGGLALAGGIYALEKKVAHDVENDLVYDAAVGNDYGDDDGDDYDAAGEYDY